MGRKDFKKSDKLRCLLLSDRHCCICDKACGLDIEIAHIDPKAETNFNNAIPVCYHHHAEIGRYNDDHPLGNKYRIEELKRRREQIYEKYTRHLVPPLIFRLAPRIEDPIELQFRLPKVGFVIENHALHLPVRVKINTRVFLGEDEMKPIINPEKPYYTNGITWNLNPGHTFFGNFGVPNACVDSPEHLWIELQVTVIDEYEREHKLLPNCFYYVRDKKHWFTEPTSMSELKQFMKK